MLLQPSPDLKAKLLQIEEQLQLGAQRVVLEGDGSAVVTVEY